NRRCRVS
ncbi:CBS domain protein, partial [Chlamydia psittaci 84-8471/1]